MNLTIESNTGLLRDVPFVASPNWNERPPVEIDLLVIHNISLPPGEFGGPYIEALFTNTLDPKLHPYFREIVSNKVSSHCLIRRPGNIIQYVPFLKRAWHAGASSFQGRENCNDYSIGIELEGTDDTPFTESQYQGLIKLIQAIRQEYPKITFDRIVGHSDVAPLRKTDPGPCFDWQHLKALLALHVTSEFIK